MLEAATEQLATIAGQQPSVRRARKSIANFKLREGMPVGVAVTLRGERSYEFLDRLMSIAIPRIRDFRGLNPRSFDGRGNYSHGHPRADHLPGDRLRLDRPGARPRRHDHHDAPHRRGGVRAARGVRHAVLAGGPAGRPDADAEAGGRGGAPQGGGAARAEAEQAALEQLKEENPEAYAKRERRPRRTRRAPRARRPRTASNPTAARIED